MKDYIHCPHCYHSEGEATRVRVPTVEGVSLGDTTFVICLYCHKRITLIMALFGWEVLQGEK
jgi:hypothetical protein